MGIRSLVREVLKNKPLVPESWLRDTAEDPPSDRAPTSQERMADAVRAALEHCAVPTEETLLSSSDGLALAKQPTRDIDIDIDIDDSGEQGLGVRMQMAVEGSASAEW